MAYNKKTLGNISKSEGQVEKEVINELKQNVV